MVRLTQAGDQLITRALAVGYPAPGQRRPLVVSGALAMLAAIRRAVDGRTSPALFVAVEHSAIMRVAGAAETVLRDRERDDRES
jgi:hypothetical protein